MNSKSHPGPRAQRHHWKSVWKDKRITKYRCVDCGMTKKATINYQGGFPTTIYELNGEQFGRAPECRKAPDSEAQPAGA